MNNRTKIISEVALILCFWLLSFVFYNWLSGLLFMILPVTSSVPNESYLIQLALLAIIGIPYVANWKSLTHSRVIPGRRWIAILSVFVFYLLFRFDGHILFYHLPKCIFSYCDLCFVEVLLFELVLRFCDHSPNELKHDTSVQRFIYDTPAKEDSFHRKEYAKVLVG